LFSAYQSHPGYAFLSPDLTNVRVGVVRKAALGADSSITMSGLPANVIELAATARSVRSMLQYLADGQVIAAYCDYVYPGSACIDTAMFGYRVSISRSLLAIAMKTGAFLVPMCIAREGARAASLVHVEFFPPIGSNKLDGFNAEVEQLAFQMGIALECLIRRYPAQWRLWNTLRERCR